MKNSLFLLFALSPLMFACDPPGSEQGEDAPAPQGAPEAATEPQPTKVALLTAEGFQDAEAFMPLGYLTNHGCEVTVVGMNTGRVKAYNSDFTIDIQKRVTDVSAAEFDALVIPGGKAPAKLRESADVINFVTAFHRSGQPIAAVCHGPQILITAGILEGRNATGVESIADELREADVNYSDEALVIDGHFITSRVPDDLPKFVRAIADAVEKQEEKSAI